MYGLSVIKNASILILDDSVSAVDTKTEKIILDNLRATRKGKTTILIAHRISAVKNSDLIVYLEDGEIKEKGTDAVPIKVHTSAPLHLILPYRSSLSISFFLIAAPYSS